MRIRHLIVPVLAASLAAACRPSPDEVSAQNAAPPPAAALAPLTSDHSVDQALELLAAELDDALEHQLDDAGIASIVRAEAITDRLLETRIPFEWIPDERYLVDSRLRQIQSDADRILAQGQSGVSRDSVLAAVRRMAEDVADLRGDLSRSGARAPPPLDQLLQGDTATRRPPE